MDGRRLSAGSESGQMAITMVLALMVAVLFFSLAFDAGLWFFDHRSAQNQSDGAALAAAGSLPANTTTAAQTAITTSLSKSGLTCMPGCVQVANGGSAPVCPSTGECITIHFQDMMFADGFYDQVTVVVRRPSPILFASLTGTSYLWISASATALAGPADIANVLPWAVVAPQPSCDIPAENCSSDLNRDGDFTDPGECNNVAFKDCPFGLNPGRLIAFKSGGGGVTGIIDACGNGATSYSDCLEGAVATGFFQAGQDVVTGLQGGNLGANTSKGLKMRFAEEVGWTPASAQAPTHNSYDAAWAASPCNVVTSPTDAVSGWDPDGRSRAISTFGSAPPQPYCQSRVILLPIVTSLPASGGGSSAIHVIGVASFGIARWTDKTAGAEAIDNGNGNLAESADDCHDISGGANPSKFGCGIVWGYFMTTDIRPPEFLLQKIGSTPNPLAPILIALVE